MRVNAYETQGFVGKTIASLRTDAGFTLMVFTDGSSAEFGDCGAWDDGKKVHPTRYFIFKKNEGAPIPFMNNGGNGYRISEEALYALREAIMMMDEARREGSSVKYDRVNPAEIISRHYDIKALEVPRK